MWHIVEQFDLRPTMTFQCNPVPSLLWSKLLRLREPRIRLGSCPQVKMGHTRAGPRCSLWMPGCAWPGFTQRQTGLRVPRSPYTQTLIETVGQSLCPERLLCLPSHTFSTWPFLSHLSSRSFTSFLRHSSRTVTSFSCVHRLCTSFYHSISKYCDLVCLTDSPVVSGSFLSYPWQRAQSLAHRSCPTKFTLYATYLSSALDSGINTTQRFTAPLFGL